MIKLHTKKNLFPTKSSSYYSYKKSFVRKISVQLFFIAVLSTASILVKYYYDSASKARSTLKKEYNGLLSKHVSTIKDNINIDKALSDFYEIKTVAQGFKHSYLISEFSSMLSYLSFYYGVRNRIEVKVLPPSKITPKISRLKISLSFKSKGDNQTMPILDSILMNARGFIFVEQIKIKKDHNAVENNIDLYWYTTANIQVPSNKSMHFYVTPKKYPYTMEEKYRISLWNGNIVS